LADLATGPSTSGIVVFAGRWSWGRRLLVWRRRSYPLRRVQIWRGRHLCRHDGRLKRGPARSRLHFAERKRKRDSELSGAVSGSSLRDRWPGDVVISAVGSCEIAFVWTGTGFDSNRYIVAQRGAVAGLIFRVDSSIAVPRFLPTASVSAVPVPDTP